MPACLAAEASTLFRSMLGEVDAEDAPYTKAGLPVDSQPRALERAAIVALLDGTTQLVEVETRAARTKLVVFYHGQMELGCMSRSEIERVGANPKIWVTTFFVLLGSVLVYLNLDVVGSVLLPLTEAEARNPGNAIFQAMLPIVALLFAYSGLFFFLALRQFHIAEKASAERRFPPQGVRLLLPMRVARGDRCDHHVRYYRLLALSNLVAGSAIFWLAISSPGL